jgi:hypothetical protein
MFNAKARMPAHEPQPVAPARPYSRLRGLALALLVALSVALLGSCGGGGGGGAAVGVDRATFARGLVEGRRVTDAQAQCVTDFVFANYDPHEIRLLHDDGLQALPSPRWGAYAHSMLTCLFHDELAGAAPR